MATASDKSFLTNIYNTLKNLDPVGYKAIEKKLEGVIDTHTNNDNYVSGMVEYIKKADLSPICMKGIVPVELVRSWYVVKLAEINCLDGVNWNEPTQIEHSNLMTDLKKLDTKKVQDQILDQISSRTLINKFAESQNNPERKAWKGKFTDPKDYHANNFQYLVVALRDEAVPLQIKEPVEQRYYEDHTRFDPKHIISEDSGTKLLPTKRYLSNPETLSSQILCCSIINQDHKKTYKGMLFGLILDVHSELIISASSKDDTTASWIYKSMGVETHQLESCAVERLFLVGDFLDTLIGKFQKELDSPGKILQESLNRKCHNEINVLGSNGGGLKIKPNGIFVKVAPNGNLYQPFWEMCETIGPDILQCSRSQKIPIVPIEDDLASSVKSDISFKDWLLGDISWDRFVGQ